MELEIEFWNEIMVISFLYACFNRRLKIERKVIALRLIFMQL